MAGVVVRGVTARLMWGYHVAASLRAWTVSRTDEEGWTLSASVERADGFKVSQQPLTFVAPHATGAWRWPVRSLAMTDGSLIASLGPKESPHAIEVRSA